MHVYLCIPDKYVCVCINECMFAYACESLCRYVCMSLCTCVLYESMNVCIYECPGMSTCIYGYVHVCMYV